VYRTQRTIDWWIEQAKKIKQWLGVEQFICDPSEPAYIEQFNKAHLNAIGAINDIAPGISALQERLKVQPDGRARFYVFDYALESRDELREAAHQPCSFTQDIDAYVWPKSKDGAPVKEVPVKVNDHALDTSRYLMMHLADPSLSAFDHLRDMQRRVEIQHQRAAEQAAKPEQGMIPAPTQKKRAWWEA
jgi:phage terminase large subunit